MPGGSVPGCHQSIIISKMNQTSASQDDVRFRVLRLLQDKLALTQREIARELGISLGGVNFCLRALADRGLVKIRNFQNSNNRLAEHKALRAEIQALGRELPDSHPQSRLTR